VSLRGWVTKWRNDPSRKAPYRIQPRHSLNIDLNVDVVNALALNGPYVVDLDGRVELGPHYGKVKLAGLTLDEATKAIDAIVKKSIEEGTVAVTMTGWEKDWQRLEDVDKPAGDAIPRHQGLGGWENDWQRLEFGDDHKSNAVPVPKFPREDLRYEGKTFDQWRRDLLTELKPDSRVDGINAMREFGANGYPSEATQVILEIMRGFDPDVKDESHQKAVYASRLAVAKIGAPAAPVII
jgi:hypothetical protein